MIGFQFIGFVFGIPLMVLPDQLGRKKSMTIILIFNLVSAYLVTYGSMNAKKVGFFGTGVFHMKATLSYTYLCELVDNDHKAISQSILSLFNELSVGIVCMYILFINQSYQPIVEIFFWACFVATFLFMAVVPESPQWLLLKDPSSKQGKEALNYIAWFNGSKKRISEDAVMDNLGQLIKDK